MLPRVIGSEPTGHKRQFFPALQVANASLNDYLTGKNHKGLDMKIVIAGAGIGGLAAAALLHDAGHDVQVYDQFDAPAPVGSGLVIQPVGQAVLQRIGVRDSAIHNGAPVTRILGKTVSGRRVLDVDYGLGAPGAFGLAIHRSGLFDVLLHAVKERGIPLTTGFRVADRDGPQLISDAGARSDTADLIIDALGAGSPLSPLKANPLGYGAVWATVDWPNETALPIDHLSQVYRRATNMIGAMPCGRGRAAIFWSLPVSDHDAFRARGLDHWQGEVKSLWPAFEPFAKQITDLDQMTFAQYSHGSLRTMWSTGLVHIGDAAHRASPQLGQGANMALLDAAALTWALGKYSGNDALRAYRHARKLHVGIYQGMSRVFTPMYQSNSHILPWLRDWIAFPLSRIPPSPRILSKLVRGDMVLPIRGRRRG